MDRLERDMLAIIINGFRVHVLRFVHVNVNAQMCK